MGSDLYGDLGCDDPTDAICPASKKMESPAGASPHLFYVADRYLPRVEQAESGSYTSYLGGGTMKTKKTQLQLLRAELHYWQMRVRMDIKSLKATKERAKEIAMKMRAVQSNKTLDKREPRV